MSADLTGEGSACQASGFDAPACRFVWRWCQRCTHDQFWAGGPGAGGLGVGALGAGNSGWTVML